MKTKVPKNGYKRLTKEKARIIAHLIGDGGHFKYKSNYIMKYEVKDNESIKRFSEDVIKTYGLDSTYGFNPSGKTGKLIPFVMLRSRMVFDDLLDYATYYSKN